MLFTCCSFCTKRRGPCKLIFRVHLHDPLQHVDLVQHVNCNLQNMDLEILFTCACKFSIFPMITFFISEKQWLVKYNTVSSAHILQ